MKRAISALLCVCLLASLLCGAVGAETSGRVSYAQAEAEFLQTGAIEADTLGGMMLATQGTESLDDLLYAGLRDVSATIDVSACGATVDELKAAFERVVNSHPELFYVMNSYSYSYAGTIVLSVTPTYDQELLAQRGTFEACANEILNSVVMDGMSDLDKALALHDYLVLNCAYNWEVGNGKTGYPSYVYSAYGPIVAGDAVCQGYALAYEYLLGLAGVSAGYVSSSTINHGWNWVAIGDACYHVDVTWDDPMFTSEAVEGQEKTGADWPGYCSHNYFLLDGATMITDHPGFDEELYMFEDTTFLSGYAFNGANSAFTWYNGSFRGVGSEGDLVTITNLNSTQSMWQSPLVYHNGAAYFARSYIDIDTSDVYCLNLGTGEKQKVATAPVQLYDSGVRYDSETGSICFTGQRYGESTPYEKYSYVVDSVVSGTCGENAAWTLNTATGTLTISGTGEVTSAPWNDNYQTGFTSVVIGEGITSLCEGAFFVNTALTSVSLPSTLRSIGNSAFSYTGLLSVALPEGLESIGESAFEGSELTSVFIPASVSSIGDGAFMLCDSLTQIAVAEENKTYCAQENILYSADKTQLLCRSAGLPDSAFTVPDFVQTLAPWCFSGSWRLNSIHLPASVSSISDYAFDSCTNLLEITVAEDNLYYQGIDGVLYTKDGTKLLLYPRLRDGAEYQVPDTVVTINHHAFSDSPLVKITLPSGLQTIGQSVFYSCRNLEEISIPSGVSVIQAYTFGGCISLRSVSLGTGLQEIKWDAFRNCTSLTDVYYAGSEEAWNAVVIDEGNDELLNATLHPNSELAEDPSGSCGETLTWTLSGGTLTISGTGEMTDYADGTPVPWADFSAQIEAVVVQNGATSIGENAFSGCNQLTSISLPVSLTRIGQNAFAGCTSLTSATYSGSSERWATITVGSGNEMLTAVLRYAVTETAHEVHSGTCGNNVTWTLDVDTGVLTISGTGGTDDFEWKKEPWYEWQSKIRVVHVEEGVTYLGAQTLSGSYLSRLELPVSLTEFGNGSGNCWNLEEIYYAGTEAQWQSVKVNDTYLAYRIKNAELHFESTGPERYVYGTIGTNLSWTLDRETGELYIDGTGMMFDDWRNSPFEAYRKEIEAVYLGEGITSIASHVFASCSLLNKVSIPEGVTQIGAQAFFSCVNLTQITLPETLQILDFRCLQNTGLTQVFIPAAVQTVDTAFVDCYSLTAITVSEDSSWFCDIDGVLLNKAKTELLCFPGAKAAPGYAVPDTVRTIVTDAFYHCAELEGEITIPASVETIEDSAFSRCAGLTGFTVAAGNPSYCSKDGVLFDKEMATLLAYPPAKETAYYAVPDTVTTVGSSAFNYCGMTSVYLPDSVTTLGDYAFEGCSSLTSVRLPQTLTEISDGAFEYCSSLRQITIPADVTSIGFCAFYNTALTSVTIPEKVVTIYSSAFNACWSLSEVSLPVSLKTVADGAFDSGTPLNNVYYAGTQAQWSSVSVGENWNDRLTNATFHYAASAPQTASGVCGTVTWSLDCTTGVLHLDGTGAMADYADAAESPFAQYGGYIREIVVADGVTKIGANTFAGILAIDRVSVTGNTEIGAGAFQNCENLKEVAFLSTVPVIGDKAFDGCWRLTVRYPAGNPAPSLENVTTEAYGQVYAALPAATADANGEVTVELTAGVAAEQSVTAICAVYDASGKMLGLTSFELETGKTSQTITCQSGNIYTLKLFVLGEDETPQLEALQTFVGEEP